MVTVNLAPPDGFDLRTTLRALGVFRSDPDGAWWATRTVAGPATICLATSGAGVHARIWGPGADALVPGLPRLLGFDDPSIDLRPERGLLRDLQQRSPGLRLGATGAVFEAIVPTVLGQVVTKTEARAGYRALIDRFGDPAPGPHPRLRLSPAPGVLAAASYEDLHPLGIERKRAAIVIECGRRAARLEQILDLDPAAARRRLRAVRGIGPWTAETVMGVAYGDRDAIPIGDFNLPSMVTWALAGERVGDDDRMLELLDPSRPFRRRVVVLLKQAGVHPPRRGPRRQIRTHLDDG